MRKWYPLFLIVIAFAASALVLGRLPEPVAIHFDARGNANGWSNRYFAAFMLPSLVLVMWPFLRFVPRIDPRWANYAKMQETYDIVVNLVLTVLVAVHAIMLAVALGVPIRVERTVPVIVGVFFVVLGNLLPRARSNWTLGVRTPWTLSNDRVWERTHRVGGYLMMGVGLVFMASALLNPVVATVVIWVAVAVMVLGTIGYSYFAWRQEGHGRDGNSAATTK